MDLRGGCLVIWAKHSKCRSTSVYINIIMQKQNLAWVIKIKIIISFRCLLQITRRITFEKQVLKWKMFSFDLFLHPTFFQFVSTLSFKDRFSQLFSLPIFGSLLCPWHSRNGIWSVNKDQKFSPIDFLKTRFWGKSEFIIFLISCHNSFWHQNPLLKNQSIQGNRLLWQNF